MITQVSVTPKTALTVRLSDSAMSWLIQQSESLEIEVNDVVFQLLDDVKSTATVLAMGYDTAGQANELEVDLLPGLMDSARNAYVQAIKTNRSADIDAEALRDCLDHFVDDDQVIAGIIESWACNWLEFLAIR